MTLAFFCFCPTTHTKQKGCAASCESDTSFKSSQKFPQSGQSELRKASYSACKRAMESVSVWVRGGWVR